MAGAGGRTTWSSLNDSAEKSPNRQEFEQHIWLVFDVEGQITTDLIYTDVCAMASGQGIGKKRKLKD